MNKKYISGYTILLLFAIASFVFIVSFKYPLLPDEFNYSHIPWTDQRLQSFKDIIISQKLMYQKWSGRIVVLGLQQVFLLYGKWIYDILNAVVFIGLICLILKFNDHKINYINAAFVSSMLFLFVINFGECVLWMSGSLNYLWPVFIMMLFLINLKKIFFYSEEAMKTKDKIIILLLAFFTGISQENTAFLAGACMFMYLIYNFKRIGTNKNKVLLLSTYLVFAIGAAILIFAPGNFQRAGNAFGLHIRTVYWNLRDIKYALLLQIIIFIILYYLKLKENIYYNIKYLIIPAFLSLLPMLLISEFPGRATFPFSVMLFTSITDGTVSILKKAGNKKYEITVGILCSIIIADFCIPSTYYVLTRVSPYFRQQKEIIARQQKEKQENAVIYRIDIPHKYCNIMPRNDSVPTNNANSVYNIYFSTYYGFKNMNAVKSDNALIELEVINEEKFNNAYNICWSYDGKYNLENSSSRLEPIGVHPGRDEDTKGLVQLEAPIANLQNIRIKLPENQDIQIKAVSIKTIYGSKKYNVDDIINLITDNKNVEVVNVNNDFLILKTKSNAYLQMNILGEKNNK